MSPFATGGVLWIAFCAGGVYWSSGWHWYTTAALVVLFAAQLVASR